MNLSRLPLWRCTLALLVLAAAIPAAAQSVPCRQDSLIPAFARFLEETAGLGPTARAERFVSDFAERHSGYFDPEVFGTPDRLLQSAERFFAPPAADTPPERTPPPFERVLAIGRQFDAMFEAEQRRFLGAFPDFRCTTLIQIGPSLGRFDGNVRDGRLRFGMDVIARLHSSETLPALIHHELFHLYRVQVAEDSGPEKLYMGLWGEGLATYVSHRLNPHLSLDQVFWYPRELAGGVDARRAEIAAAMLAELDSEDSDEFLSARPNERGFPPRSGYYFGYRLAEELGRRMTLFELARLEPEAVRRHVEAFLRRQATPGNYPVS